METVSIVLAFPATLMLLYFSIRDFWAEVKARRFLKEKFWVILSIPVLIFVLFGIAGTHYTSTLSKDTLMLGFSVAVAALISGFWLMYLTWLDIYEREKKRYLLLTFVMCCVSTFLVFPISGFIHQLGFVKNGSFWNDFLYCVFTIGYVEEFVKFLPWYLMWRFSRQLDEPFDFILYASVSALGFAFVENVGYLFSSDLTGVYARALFSSIAHMFFSSSVAYALVWWEYKGKKVNIFVITGALLIAALEHGFYDFWLIREEYGLEILTMLFFLASLHTWVVMKNNLINISGFYKPELKLRSHLFMYRLISFMLIVFAVALTGFNMVYGYEATRQFLWQMFLNYAYIFAYITVSFSSFQVVKGYIRPLRFPGKLLLPKVIRFPDFSGREVVLLPKGGKVPVKGSIIEALAGRRTVLVRRAVIDGVANAYYIDTAFGGFITQFVKRHPEKDDIWQIVLLKPKSNITDRKPSYKQTALKKLGYLLGRFD